MKKMAVFLVIFCLLGGTAVATYADETEKIYREQAEAVGADSLLDSLPEETKDILRSLGITDLEVESYTTLQPKRLMNTLLGLFGNYAGGAAANCGVLLGVLVLGAFAESLRQTVNDAPMSEMLGRLCAVGTGGVILWPVMDCVQQVYAATDGVHVMMLSFIPAYAAAVFSSGRVALATSYSTVLFAGAECVSSLVTGVALPLLTVSLGVGIAGTISEKNRLATISSTLAKSAIWILATVTTLFTALLSMQSLVAATSDSLTQRAAKMTIGSLVPIVGGALSEAFGTVTGCVQLLHTTLGMFGVLATAALVLPSFFRCLSWSLALGLCRMASEAMGVESVTGLLSTVQAVMKALMGVLAACALFLIITTTLVTMVGR